MNKCQYKITKEDVFWTSYLVVFRVIPGKLNDLYRSMKDYLNG